MCVAGSYLKRQTPLFVKSRYRLDLELLASGDQSKASYSKKKKKKSNTNATASQPVIEIRKMKRSKAGTDTRRRRPRPAESPPSRSAGAGRPIITTMRQLATTAAVLLLSSLLVAGKTGPVVLAAVSCSPSSSSAVAVEVGIRSALGNTVWKRRTAIFGSDPRFVGRSRQRSLSSRNLSPAASSSSGSSCGLDDTWTVSSEARQPAASSSGGGGDIREILPAFFRPGSADERDQLLSAEYAYQSKGPSSRTGSCCDDGPETELDLLESLAVPCSAVRQVRLSVAGKSPATAAAAAAPSESRGGASAAAVAAIGTRNLVFWENMIAGAISRSVAQTLMHPANTMKTIFQNARTPMKMVDFMTPSGFRRLSVGAGANFVLSVPHGAVNFAVLEFVRKQLSNAVERTPFLSERADTIGPGLDFMSSAISTITCSVVSTPQMMITDNIMAGNYPNLVSAIKGLAQSRGVSGFYAGWWPGLVGKIPSYALTWTIFQQLKRVRDTISDRSATNFENTVMGCIASGTTVCIMIPLDTIKTRLVTQAGLAASERAYKGIVDCAIKVAREEGIKTFYRGLSPRLISVVPMIGIQFGVYEFMKNAMVGRPAPSLVTAKKEEKQSAPTDDAEYGSLEVMQEAAMEVAASPEHPYPAPHFIKRFHKQVKKGNWWKKSTK